MKKVSGWKTKGMNRDLSVSAFNPEFAFENMNLRLSTNEGNTALSWVNEKGTAQINLMQKGRDASLITLYGVCIGTAVLNEYLVLFITERGYADAPDGIYRLESTGEYTMDVTALYEGNLKFDREHPIETLVSYEAKDIQKVYWTDGINQPRLINISPDNDKNRSRYTDTSFDFIPTLQLNETIKVKKVHGGGGMFAPGVIQYAFTYYNKHGQESNIFYVTPLLYISHIDRGASPEDKVDNIFKISITGIDTNFDYLRIYSIQRTSINSTPICKRVQDITIEGEVIETGNASFTDNGTMGNSIDPTELLFKGGNKVWIGTMEQKDNTLFMGDLTTPAMEDLTDFQDGDKNRLKESIAISLRASKRTFYSLQTSTGDYEYANQLNSYNNYLTEFSVPCAGFKYGNKYRCGIQFQDETGKWSTPVWLDDLDVLNEKADPEEGDIRPTLGRVSRGESEKDTPTIPDIEPSGSGDSGGSSSEGGESGDGSGEDSGGSSGENSGEGTPVTGNESYATAGTPGTIGFNIINKTGHDIYYSGLLKLHIKKGSGENAWGSDGKLVSSAEQVSWPLNPPTDKGEPYKGYYYAHYWRNNKIPAGGSKLFTMSSFKTYAAGKTGVVEKSIPLSTYCDGNWYFVTSDNSGYKRSGGNGGIPAIWLGCAIRNDDGTKTNNAFLHNVSPVRKADSKIRTGKVYNLVVYKAHTENKYWSKIIK